jgi:hypothetical protein
VKAVNSERIISGSDSSAVARKDGKCSGMSVETCLDPFTDPIVLIANRFFLPALKTRRKTGGEETQDMKLMSADHSNLGRTDMKILIGLLMIGSSDLDKIDVITSSFPCQAEATIIQRN